MCTNQRVLCWNVKSRKGWIGISCIATAKHSHISRPLKIPQVPIYHFENSKYLFAFKYILFLQLSQELLTFHNKARENENKFSKPTYRRVVEQT